jgi:hypothetical protein
MNAKETDETAASWPELRWDEAVDRVSRCVVRLHAGTSAGTGFVIGIGRDKQTGSSYATIATALHVLQPLVGTPDELEIVSVDMNTAFSSATDQIGFYPLGEITYDTALAVVRTGAPLVSENELLPLLPSESMLARGSEIGWLGFPGITKPELCFFHGHISGYLADPPAYLVDGVAINGVSGGPVFDNRAHVIGLVSAYLPNRIDQNTTLPGVMVVVSINAIRNWMEHVLGARVLKKKDLLT